MKIGLTLGVLICAAGMVAVAPSGIAQTKSKVHIKIPVVAAKPEDVTLESIVKADYDSISGGVGVPRQWARDLSLYDPHAWTVALSTDPKTGAITTWSFNEQEYADATDAEFVS